MQFHRDAEIQALQLQFLVLERDIVELNWERVRRKDPLRVTLGGRAVNLR